MASYLILSMKRSGHHGFVNWLCKQHGDITHINNATNGWEDGNFTGGKVTKYGFGVDTCVSIEDFDIDDWDKFKFDRMGFTHVVVFIRDFRNWLASCLKRREYSGDYRDVYEALTCQAYRNDRGDVKPNRIELWKKHIRLFDSNPHGFHLVSYNKWVTDKLYRADIAQAMGVAFTDEGLREVSTFGQGSSFDGTNHSNIDDMDVLKRYQQFEDDEEYKKIISDHKLLAALSEDLLI